MRGQSCPAVRRNRAQESRLQISKFRRPAVEESARGTKDANVNPSNLKPIPILALSSSRWHPVRKAYPAKEIPKRKMKKKNCEIEKMLKD